MPVYRFVLRHIFFMIPVRSIFFLTHPKWCWSAQDMFHNAKIYFSLRPFFSFFIFRLLSLKLFLQIVVNKVADWCLFNENGEECFFPEDCFYVGVNLYAYKVMLCILIIFHNLLKRLQLLKVHF